jgi:hypothetical protein
MRRVSKGARRFLFVEAPMMNRRDFAAIAAVLARARLSMYSGEIDSLVSDMADALATTNPDFDRQRFLAACSMEAAHTLLTMPDG